MNVVLSILQGGLALAFAMAGVMKLMQPREKLAANMPWVEDFSSSTVKGIGAAELLGAIGLVVPPLTDIAPILAPFAAIGLATVMIGAAFVHRRRGETQMIIVNATLGIMALIVAWGRLGPEPA